jgi:hypothetical protein
VAQDVTQSGVDCGQLVPLTDAVETNLGRKPAQLSADAGYCSEANLAALEARDIDAYVAAGRARDAVAGNGGQTRPGKPTRTIRSLMRMVRLPNDVEVSVSEAYARYFAETKKKSCAPGSEP